MENLPRDDARQLLNAILSELRGLLSEEFFSPASLSYHPVRDKIARFAWSLNPPAPELQEFLRRHGHSSEAWLPIDVGALDGIETAELLLRLKINISGDRWAKGALAPAFASGTLLRALERIDAGLDGLI
ncbi:hypothetical protein FQ775_07110 [Nitratireductor mangrovi]|uniref:Uncharacterized protein n=1 Tax=Nitratireductor mangrovi TaxID=2599600 RepID=A0A5B8KX75_9HYPH|nr:hypothetical protein [Nitratireductor mangrovi]QDZ00169.1 hypothetical protein FQ775_07110 [Nitratireductor mangrovi]